MDSNSKCADHKDNPHNQRILLADLSWEDIVFSTILPYLSWRDLFYLRATCWQLREMVDAYFQQLKCIDVTSVSCRFSADAFKVVSQHCESLRKLVLQNAHWLSDRDIIPVLKRNRLLSYIDLSECGHLKGTCLLALAVNCKQLKTLLLRNFLLTPGAIETLISHLDSLEVVDLSSCSAISNQQLLPFLQKFYKLKELYIANLPAQTVNDSIIIAIARCMKWLRVLDIRGCATVTDSGVRMLAEYCNAEFCSLFVNGCSQVSERSLQLLRSRGINIDRRRAELPVLYVPRPVQV